MVCVADVTPSAVHVGNIVQGARLAWAQGRDIGMLDEDSDTARKVRRACAKKGVFALGNTHVTCTCTSK